jgi:threonine/homoserine/homoserine lactone efflux protein
VVYQLDYNREGLAHKDEYLKMFEDCGWEYIQDYAGYSYFRKAVAENGAPEEIFCDTESKIQMMERVIKGRMMPLLIIFFATLLPQFLLNLFSYHNYFVAVLIGSILALYVAVFAMCFVKYRNYKNPQ